MSENREGIVHGYPNTIAVIDSGCGTSRKIDGVVVTVRWIPDTVGWRLVGQQMERVTSTNVSNVQGKRDACE
jgi:hypothetical protein